MKREAVEQGEEEGVTCPRKRINPHILIQVFFFISFLHAPRKRIAAQAYSCTVQKKKKGGLHVPAQAHQCTHSHAGQRLIFGGQVDVENVQVMIAFFFLVQQLADIWRESGLRQGRSDARRLVDARCEQAARVQVYIHICIYILIAEPLVCSSFLLVLKVDS